MNNLISPERGCGRRAAGGVYAETRISRDGGQPLEFFLVDPPQAVDLNRLGLTAVGVRLVEIEGVWHIFDIVGEEHYPYPADYVEETRLKGASRRLSRNLDFSKLSPEGRLVLVHRKAIIQNFHQYPQPPIVECPKMLAAHAVAPLEETCAGLWWHDIHAADGELQEGCILRKLAGSTEYYAHPRPHNMRPEYQHGIFMMLPITNLAVIRGRNAGEMAVAEQSFQAASKSGLPVYLEEE
jgi:hypothetical protein